MSSQEKIVFNDGITTVHKSIIRQELASKMSEEDIYISEDIINKMRNNKKLTMKILTGNDCSGCEELNSDYMKKSNNSKVIPYGSMESPIVFVNKMPTVLDCGSGISHSDTAGYFLMLVLKKLGYNPSDFYFTDFVKCPNQRITVNDCWHCASNYFMQEIKLIKPKVLVCEGLYLLKILKEQNILLNVPETLEHGVMYDTCFITNDIPMKVISIFDLSMLLTKEGSDLQQCKNGLWTQLTNIVQTIKN